LGTPLEKVFIPPEWDIWELERSDVTLGEKIGEGNFGEVYKGTLSGKMNPKTGMKSEYTVAIKTLKLKNASLGHNCQAAWEKGKADFLAELAIMKKLRHENFNKLAMCSSEIGM
jgi:serine/threonine protein kinase